MLLEINGKNYESLTHVPIHCFLCGEKLIHFSVKPEGFFDEESGKPITKIEIDCPDEKHRGGIKPLYFQFIEVGG